MTQEEKQVLLPDLCARLPYGVKVKVFDKDILLYDSKDGFIKGKENMEDDDFVVKCHNDSWVISCEDFKPYLRPMFSMTEEEREEANKLWDIVTKTRNDLHYLYTDFLFSHHLDFRGLIPMGVALEAPEGMYDFSNRSTGNGGN